MEQLFYKDFNNFFMENVFSNNIAERYFLKKNLNRRLFNKTFLSKNIFIDNYINWFFYKYYNMNECHHITFNEFIEKTSSLFAFTIKNNISKIHKNDRESIVIFIKNIRCTYIKVAMKRFKNKYAYIGDYFVNIKHYLKLFFAFFTSIILDIIKDEDINYSQLDLPLLMSLCLERRFALTILRNKY